MQDKIQISVVIPNYNRSNLLLKAVQSCLNQTFPVHEVLVCDDGSADDSKKMIESINDARVKWVDCGKNGRPAIPRNMGIKKATGNWIAFLDNDDEWLREKLEIQVKIIEKYDVNFVCSNAYRMVDGKNIGALGALKNDQLLNFYNLVTSNNVICSSTLIKKEVLEQFSYFPEEPELRALEDYAFWLKIATRNNVYYSSQCLLNYNDESQTSIRKDSLTTQQQMKLIFTSFKQWAEKNNSLCEDYMVAIIEQVFVIRYLTKTQQFFYKLFR